jgi:hypothetical protein
VAATVAQADVMDGASVTSIVKRRPPDTWRGRSHVRTPVAYAAAIVIAAV